MAKSDFEIEDEFQEDNQKEPIANNNQDKSLDKTDLYDMDYGENSDFSNIGLSKQQDFIENADVVFEEKKNESKEDKIKYALSTINKKAVIALGIALLFLILIVVVIYIIIARNNALYKSEVIIPDAVYLGETANISVIAEGKEALDNTKTTFKSSDTKVATVLEEEMTGRDILNTIVPIQEGKTTITVNSILDKREMADEKKDVVVCPSFTSDLVFSERISIVKDTTHELNIGFGQGACSEDIYYETSNDEIMTVSAEGEIKGIKVGSAILTISKGSRSFSVPVYVTEDFVPMTKLNVTPEKVQLTPGQNTRLKISTAPYNTTAQNIDFYSNDESIATVDEYGFVTAVKEGTTTIRVTNGNRTVEDVVTIVVTKAVSEEGSIVTDLTLNKSSLTMIQGDSEKIVANITPDNAKDKTITWTSSNSDIVTVTSEGVIYAKDAGKAVITAKTSNNISKTVEVTVSSMASPTITASDGITSNKWHHRAYTLKFSGSESGTTYYYGTSENQVTTKASELKISKDEKTTYYVKACKENICSKTVSYISKTDITKPKVVTVAGIESTTVTTDDVHIALQDTTSLIRRWCVTKTDSSNTCKWTTINAMANPVVTYTARSNGTYYVFAQDVAGNVSDSLSFEITNIG